MVPPIVDVLLTNYGQEISDVAVLVSCFVLP